MFHPPLQMLMFLDPSNNPSAVITYVRDISLPTVNVPVSGSPLMSAVDTPVIV